MSSLVVVLPVVTVDFAVIFVNFVLEGGAVVSFLFVGVGFENDEVLVSSVEDESSEDVSDSIEVALGGVNGWVRRPIVS